MTKQEKIRAKGKNAEMDNRLVQALSHPLRAECLAILNTRCASPKELLPLLGLDPNSDKDLSYVSYHVRQLLRWDCVEIVSKEQIRGAVKTVYRATSRMLLDDDNWQKLTKETRGGISINAVNEVIDLATTALEAGTFDTRTDRHVITMKMSIDEQGWQEVASVVAACYSRLSKVETDAVNRTPDPEKRFRATVSLLSYESPSSA